MKGQLVKLDQLKLSRNNDATFQRLKFQLEDGSFAMTDVVPTYRNYVWWRPVVAAGVGVVIDNISLITQASEKAPKKINADSQVRIIDPALFLKK